MGQGRRPPPRAPFSNTPTSPRRRALAPCALLAATSLLVATGCSGTGDGPDRSRAGQSAPAGAGTGGASGLGTRYSAWGPQGKVELRSLERVGGKAVVAVFRLTNESDEEYPVGTSLGGDGKRNRDRPGSVDTNAMSAVSLLDGVNSRQHFPLNRKDGQCLCTRYRPMELQPVKPGQKDYELRAAFPAPPGDVRAMTVLFPHAPPFLDVPLTDVKARDYTFDEDQGPLDPAGTETNRPLVLPVLSTVETGDDARDDDGTNLSVRLSADVLFATNKAELNAGARDRLKAVAAEIDRSRGAVVKVDGHTDDTGNDAVNEPLSRGRAESVTAALKELVTRRGVTFEARGHGSGQPVASNDRETGRRKNRRVTVSFARPEPPAAAQASPARAADGWPRPVVARTELDPNAPQTAPGDRPEGVVAEINGLERAPSGLATLVVTLVNNGRSTPYDPSLLADLDGLYAGSGTSGVTLQAGDRRVRSLRTEDRSIVGSPDFTSFSGPRFHAGPGGRVTVWTTYRLPRDITEVTVQIPGFRPAGGVRVS